MIIDFMDSNKTKNPHLLHRSRSDPEPLKLRLGGVIAHGQAQEEFGYIVFEFSSEANVCLNVLLRTLEKLSGGDLKNLPRHLHVQMDNSGKENKNNMMHGFLAALVQLDYFDVVDSSYLLVGHTHEDIDGMFSRSSRSVQISLHPRNTLVDAKTSRTHTS